MADSEIQLPADGTGKKVQTFENTIGAEQVHAEAVVEVDPATGAPVPPKATEATLAAMAAMLDYPISDVLTAISYLMGTRPSRNLADIVSAIGSLYQDGSTVYVDGTAMTYEQNQLVPSQYDAIGLGYTGDDLTSVTYYQGGLAGSVIATLTLAYDVPGGKMTSVVRS